ncbi:MAG: diacylglycerol kinase family lipid kinase [Sedimentisphaerales bacterium]|nr:diacylglycerol kinase family lipid kinase [Sedimentisphaerales bacterium]
MNLAQGYIEYIINPKSGSVIGKGTAKKFANYLRNNGYDVRVDKTKSMEHVCQLATKAAMDADCSMVAVAGGDGTVREVAHGLEGSGKRLMIIPSGTENLLAKELGTSNAFKRLVEVFEDGFISELDLGIANGRCFTSIAGLGFDGDVIKKISEKRKGHITHLHYLQPILQTVRDHEFPNIRVIVDDEEIFNGQGEVFVGNISRYATGLRILRDADFSDGLLDVCVYKCASRIQFVKHYIKTIFRVHAHADDVIYRQCKKIYISSSSKNVRTQIDGDPGPELPIKIEVIPNAVRVFVSKSGKRAEL